MKYYLISSLMLLSSQAAIASDELSNAQPVAKFSLFGGLTYGGDDLAKLEYEDDSTAKVTGGGLVSVGGGITFSLMEQFELQTNIAYHLDSASAKNGDVTFSRIALEAIPYYKPNDNLSLGLGLGLHTNVELDSDFGGSASFDSANAFIISGKYQIMSSNSVIEVRYVTVDYKLDKVGGFSVPDYYANENKISGNHVGVYYHWVFN